jgi:phospholipid/cholesterol/gamma-HCH transport system substrate-binding protein
LKIKREVKVGVLVVFSLAFLYWGMNFLKGRNFFNKSRVFYAVYDQVNGLTESNEVLVNGYKIGIVSQIKFIDSKGRMCVKILVENELDIPKNSVARIYSSNLMGSKAIEILLGNSKELAVNGDTLTSKMALTVSEEVSVQMLPLKLKAEDLMLSIDSVLSVIQYVFNEDTRENLKKSFESIKITIQNLESTSYNIDTLVASQRSRLSMIFSNVESITSNIKNNNSKLSNIITNFSALSDTLSKAKVATTINNANKALKDVSEITQKINSGQGSLGLLLNNDSVYNNLDNSSKQLSLLLEDMRLNPSRYVSFSVFGKNPNKAKSKPASSNK